MSARSPLKLPIRPQFSGDGPPSSMEAPLPKRQAPLAHAGRGEVATSAPGDEMAAGIEVALAGGRDDSAPSNCDVDGGNGSSRPVPRVWWSQPSEECVVPVRSFSAGPVRSFSTSAAWDAAGYGPRQPRLWARVSQTLLLVGLYCRKPGKALEIARVVAGRLVCRPLHLRQDHGLGRCVS